MSGPGRPRVALLAGGTGGGKLAAGLQEVLGEDLSVIVNTGDDTILHGLYISVDPDLVTFWLAGTIDEERGYGFRDDAFTVNDQLEAARRARAGSRCPTATSRPRSTAPTSSRPAAP